MQWKWLALILIPSLLTGCVDRLEKKVTRLVAEHANPFAARPPCPDAGDKPLIEPPFPCFSLLVLTDTTRLEKDGVVTGNIPYAAIKEMKIHRDGDSEGQKAVRDEFDPGAYGEHSRELLVKNVSDLKNDLARHDDKNKLVAYFVRNVGEDKLTYIPEAHVCTEKEKLILQHAKEGGYGKYEIPPRYIEECRNLATIWDRNKVAN